MLTAEPHRILYDYIRESDYIRSIGTGTARINANIHSIALKMCLVDISEGSSLCILFCAIRYILIYKENIQKIFSFYDLSIKPSAGIIIIIAI